MKSKAERRTEICRTVSEAVKALSKKKSMDWARDTAAISAAQDELDSAMFDYVQGTTTREQVKKSYKRFADLHVVEKGLSENG